MEIQLESKDSIHINVLLENVIKDSLMISGYYSTFDLTEHEKIFPLPMIKYSVLELICIHAGWTLNGLSDLRFFSLYDRHYNFNHHLRKESFLNALLYLGCENLIKQLNIYCFMDLDFTRIKDPTALLWTLFKDQQFKKDFTNYIYKLYISKSIKKHGLLIKFNRFIFDFFLKIIHKEINNEQNNNELLKTIIAWSIAEKYNDDFYQIMSTFPSDSLLEFCLYTASKFGNIELFRSSEKIITQMELNDSINLISNLTIHSYLDDPKHLIVDYLSLSRFDLFSNTNFIKTVIKTLLKHDLQFIDFVEKLSPSVIRCLLKKQNYFYEEIRIKIIQVLESFCKELGECI